MLKAIMPKLIQLRLERRRVYKDSSLTLKGTLFEVPPILSGKKVDIYFDTHIPILRVLVQHAGKDFGVAQIVDSYANTNVKRIQNQLGTLEVEYSDSALPVNLRTSVLGGKR